MKYRKIALILTVLTILVFPTLFVLKSDHIPEAEAAADEYHVGDILYGSTNSTSPVLSLNSSAWGGWLDIRGGDGSASQPVFRFQNANVSSPVNYRSAAYTNNMIYGTYPDVAMYGINGSTGFGVFAYPTHAFFKEFDITDWSWTKYGTATGSMDLVSTQYYSSPNSIRWTVTGTTNTLHAYKAIDTTLPTAYTAQFRVRWNGSSSSYYNIFLSFATTGPATNYDVALQKSNTGMVRVVYIDGGGSTQTYLSTTAMTINTWQNYTAKRYTNNSMAFWLDGAYVGKVSNTRTPIGAYAIVGKEVVSSVILGTFWIDDIKVVNDNTATTIFEYNGDSEIGGSNHLYLYSSSSWSNVGSTFTSGNVKAIVKDGSGSIDGTTLTIIGNSSTKIGSVVLVKSGHAFQSLSGSDFNAIGLLNSAQSVTSFVVQTGFKNQYSILFDIKDFWTGYATSTKTGDSLAPYSTGWVIKAPVAFNADLKCAGSSLQNSVNTDNLGFAVWVKRYYRTETGKYNTEPFAAVAKIVNSTGFGVKYLLDVYFETYWIYGADGGSQASHIGLIASRVAIAKYGNVVLMGFTDSRGTQSDAVTLFKGSATLLVEGKKGEVFSSGTAWKTSVTYGQSANTITNTQTAARNFASGQLQYMYKRLANGSWSSITLTSGNWYHCTDALVWAAEFSDVKYLLKNRNHTLTGTWASDTHKDSAFKGQSTHGEYYNFVSENWVDTQSTGQHNGDTYQANSIIELDYTDKEASFSAMSNSSMSNGWLASGSSKWMTDEPVAVDSTTFSFGGSTINTAASNWGLGGSFNISPTIGGLRLHRRSTQGNTAG